MPKRDGTGPAGPGKGIGIGRQAENGIGRGRNGGPASAGPDGYCVCPSCGEKVAHKRAVPCFTIKCPKCGDTMNRK
ncbi:MAG: hypothetical protein ACOX4P_07020 [Anaerovoracaceae bacterium]